MKKLTTQEIIRALPLEQTIKERLASQFDSLDEDIKLEISAICWKAFHEMKTTIENYWRDRIATEIANGKRDSTMDLDQQLYQEVWKDIDERISGKQEDNSKLTSIRAQLEKLMEEKVKNE